MGSRLEDRAPFGLQRPRIKKKKIKGGIFSYRFTYTCTHTKCRGGSPPLSPGGGVGVVGGDTSNHGRDLKLTRREVNLPFCVSFLKEKEKQQIFHCFLLCMCVVCSRFLFVRMVFCFFLLFWKVEILEKCVVFFQEADLLLLSLVFSLNHVCYRCDNES